MGFERRDLDELDMAICDSLLLLESFDDEDFNRDERHGQHKFILISFFFSCLVHYSIIRRHPRTDQWDKSLVRLILCGGD